MSEIFKSSTLIRETVPVLMDVNTKATLMFLSVGPVASGDLLDIRAHIQATNENLLSIAWNMYVTLNVAGDAVSWPNTNLNEAGTVTLGGQLDRATGRNLLRPIHHDGLVNSYLYPVPSSFQNFYVALCVTVKPLTKGTVRGKVLNINYGALTVRKN